MFVSKTLTDKSGDHHLHSIEEFGEGEEEDVDHGEDFLFFCLFENTPRQRVTSSPDGTNAPPSDLPRA